MLNNNYNKQIIDGGILERNSFVGAWILKEKNEKHIIHFKDTGSVYQLVNDEDPIQIILVYGILEKIITFIFQ